MKMIYTHESAFIVENIKNIVEQSGIQTCLKNQFAQGALGEISVFDSWPQLWIIDDSDFQQAQAIVSAANQATAQASWQCSKCQEPNEANFEICWHCQTEKDINQI